MMTFNDGRLSQRQTVVSPATTKLASYQLSVFSYYESCYTELLHDINRFTLTQTNSLTANFNFNANATVINSLRPSDAYMRQ